MTAALIKERLSLRDVAAMCGTDLPRDGVKFRSPLRPDRNPSCTIKGEVMRDWSRNQSYDAISFYAAAKGISIFEAKSRLSGFIRGGDASGEARARVPVQSLTRSAVVFSVLAPSDDDFASILRARQMPPDAFSGLLLAHSLGVLRFARVAGFDSWLVSDEARRCAEARRLDGHLFPPIGNLAERKAHTLRGSTKSWPVGLALPISESRAEQLRQQPLLLVEGGPDLVAAFGLLAALPMSASDVQPVAMLGTSASISPEALQKMKGRRAIILAHGDAAGKEAGERWGEQLAATQCRVCLRHLQSGKDLNDLVSTHGLDAAKELLQ
jgi:hypothetical protein